MQGQARYKDNAIGNQSLHSDCSGPFESEQFDVRTNFLVTKAVVTQKVDCTAI